jgi:hypothetical protein
MLTFTNIVYADLIKTFIVNTTEELVAKENLYNFAVSYDEDKNDLKFSLNHHFPGAEIKVKRTFNRLVPVSSGNQVPKIIKTEKDVEIGLLPMLACSVSITTYFENELHALTHIQDVEFEVVFSFYGVENTFYSNHPIFKNRDYLYAEHDAPKVTCIKVPNTLPLGRFSILLRTQHTALKNFLLNAPSHLISRMKSLDRTFSGQGGSWSSSMIGGAQGFEEIQITKDCESIRNEYEKKKEEQLSTLVGKDCSDDLSYLADVKTFNEKLKYMPLSSDKGQTVLYHQGKPIPNNETKIRHVTISSFNNPDVKFSWVLGFNELGSITITNSNVSLGLSLDSIKKYFEESKGAAFQFADRHKETSLNIRFVKTKDTGKKDNRRGKPIIEKDIDNFMFRYHQEKKLLSLESYKLEGIISCEKLDVPEFIVLNKKRVQGEPIENWPKFTEQEIFNECERVNGLIKGK